MEDEDPKLRKFVADLSLDKKMVLDEIRESCKA
jgi:hypothetical protein